METDYPDYEVILADNQSEDSTVEWVQNNHPEVKIYTFDKNYGYAEGNNRGAQFANNETLIFLNNDAMPEPDWLYQMNQTIGETGANIIQPKIRSVAKPGQFEYAGAAGGYIDWLGYPFCRGRIFDSIESDKGQYDQAVPLFWASGAAFMINKELFQKLNGFDTTFEFHMEEIDLCWRALKHGAKILFSPKSKVYHLGGGSLNEGSARKVFYNYRNSLLMLTKNLDRFVLPRIFLRLILDGVAGIRFLFLLKPMNTLAIIRAHFSFYRMLPFCLKQRRELKNNVTVSTPKSVIYERSILIDYFLKGKQRFSDLNNFNPGEDPDGSI